MKIIVSLDENNGYMFNNRRTSFDISIVKDIKELLKDNEICVSEYTYKKYSSLKELNLPLKKINSLTEVNNKWYLLEDIEIENNINITKIVIYFLNTIYPSDKKFTLYLSDKFKCVDIKEIKSDIYEELIRKIYVKV